MSGATSFTVGGVLARVAGLVRSRFGTMLLLGLVLGFLPRFCWSTAVMSIGVRPIWLAAWGGLPVVVVSDVLLRCAVTRASTLDGPDRGGLLRTGFAAAFQAFLPNLGILLFSDLAIGLGALLLVVPGLLIACRWIVATPAQVAERRGVFAALQRSHVLTRGCRWRIFALLLIYVALAGLGAATQVFGIRLPFVPTLPFWAVRALFTAREVAFTVLRSCGVAALYLELVRAKEGGPTREVAAVFA